MSNIVQLSEIKQQVKNKIYKRKIKFVMGKYIFPKVVLKAKQMMKRKENRKYIIFMKNHILSYDISRLISKY